MDLNSAAAAGQESMATREGSPEPAPAPSASAALRVLVVDDAKAIRMLVRASFRKKGWEVELADGGTQALAALPTFRPEVVVCDLNMPEMDGVEVLSRIVAQAPGLPVIMHSDEGELSRVLGAVRNGAFDFIPKGKDLGALMAAVDRAAKHGALLRDNQRLADELRAVNQTLEKRVEERTLALDASLRELQSAQNQVVHAEKFSALGQLAAGVAHEINTPIQFIGDSISFLGEAFGSLSTLIEGYRRRIGEIAEVFPGVAEELAALEEQADLSFTLEQAPGAIGRSRDGIDRVAAIVRAMKEFAHPGHTEKEPANLNDAIRRTLTMASNEIKYVADVELDLAELPPVMCNVGEINQVLLNILVNASHAVADKVRGTEDRGRVTVRTEHKGNEVVIAISDTGGGIPEAIRARIFDPFFTTKEVGRGSGIGLALARSVIADKHAGRLTFETAIGVGTTFLIALPVT